MLLTVVLVASLVLGALPGIVQEVSAATVDAGTLGAGKDGQLINGVYEIYFPGTDLCITPVDNGYDAGTVMELTTVQHWYSQRWIIEYGGTYDLTAASGDEGHYYTIRSIYNGRLLAQNGNSQPAFSSNGNTGNPYAQWRINYDPAAGSYTIQNVGQDQYYDCFISAASATAGTDLSVTESGAYNHWELRRLAIQDYSEAWRLESGTYRVQNVYNTYWQSISSISEPHPQGSNKTDDTGYDGLGYNTSKVTDGTQLFQFDWTSGGYVTFFDSKTGRYIGDRNGKTTALDVALSQVVDSPSNSFDDRLRFYWIPIPVYSTYAEGSDDGITRQENAYYLCNALTGRCLYISIATNSIRADQITHTAWYFTPMSANEIAAEGSEQGYNGDTGVYLDSMDETNIIRMPIKIYDYLNDGMLFEYAQNKDSGTASIDISGSVLEKYNTTGTAAKTFQMGNNTVFTFQSGSRGGAWVTYNSNGYPKGGNDPGVWNTYQSFLMGKVWTMQNLSGVPTSGWYTIDGSAGIFGNSSIDYSWEAYGLGAFRNENYNNLLDKDTASVYYIAGINDEIEQGINKTTYYPSGGNYGQLNVELQSGTATVTSNSITYSGDPYKLYGYVTGHTTIGLVQPTLNSVTNAPEYRDVTIEYLAYMLKETLEIPQTNTIDGTEYWAYNYVLGTTHDRYSYTRDDGTVRERDLADWLRSRMSGTKKNGFSYNGTLSYDYIGTYADTLYKLDPANGMGQGQSGYGDQPRLCAGSDGWRGLLLRLLLHGASRLGLQHANCHQYSCG